MQYMPLVHRVIREEHLGELLNGGLYFAPCDAFVDLLEFRFGYCWDFYDLGAEAFQRCIQKSFAVKNVNARIASTSICCWTEHPTDKHFMWEVYGKSMPAVFVSVERDRLVEHIESSTRLPGVAGSVRYAFGISGVRPEFLYPFNGLTEDQKKEYDLFFHKHLFYAYEDEFRIILFEKGPVILPLAAHLLQSITLSPLASFKPKVLSSLQAKFGAIVRESQLP